MKHPTWDDIRRFCEVDGWEARTTVKGRRGDHDRFTERLPDGRVLRTRASHGSDQLGDPGLVRHILRDQLEVSADEFWTAVAKGIAPVRGAPPPEVSTEEPAHQLPDWLAVNLALNVGLSDEQIASLSEEEAMRRWTDWCGRQST